MLTTLNVIFQRVRSALADPRLHEFLWYCVPGVAVAFVLRAWLTVAMPFGYYHPDTHDFLTTVYTLVARHHWTVHGKTTFLTPVLYTLAFFPKVPALITIPLAQHARGLLLVLGVGALGRLWFVQWRWLIVPLTVLAAMQPAMIFWEHTLMSESGFVFCAVMLALAGTFFVLRPGWTSYGCLLAGMLFVAAARPEGNLWQGTGILLTGIVYWGRWKLEWIKVAGAVVMAIFTLAITKTTHSGLLLYASLVHFTPDEPRTVPEFGPYIQPLRDEYRKARAETVPNDVVKAGKRINEALAAYVKDHPKAKLGLSAGKKKKADTEADSGDEDEPEINLRHGNNLSNICRRLAIESALSRPWALPGYAWHKFVAPINIPAIHTGGYEAFRDYEFHEKQARSLFGKPNIIRTLGRGLTGTRIDSPETARVFVDRHYEISRVEWFNRLEAWWQAAVTWAHLPDSSYSAKYKLPGLPIYQLLAMLGATVALFRPGPTRRFHWAFVPVMAGAGFVVMLTAAVIPRHRFVWEPFWLLYGLFLLDALISAGWWLQRRRLAPRPEATELSAELTRS